MNAHKEMIKGIEWILDNRTAYRVAKDLKINARTINRYQNGETPLENMSLKTAGKIYNYYKELAVMNFNNTQELADYLDVELESEGFDEEIASRYNVVREDIEGVPFQIIDNEIHIIE